MTPVNPFIQKNKEKMIQCLDEIAVSSQLWSSWCVCGFILSGWIDMLSDNLIPYHFVRAVFVNAIVIYHMNTYALNG